MTGVFTHPRPSQIKDANNGILQVVTKLDRALPEFGYEYVEDPRAAHVFVRHAGSDNNLPVHVTHCHGLVPTAMYNMSDVASAINAAVIDNIIKARAVTVPSEWVADIIRRDMRFDPYVIPWGIDAGEWGPGENRGYVLWAKGRPDLVCSPEPMNRLAELAGDVEFISTFGDRANNVNVVGVQPFSAMKSMIANAGVYLATTRETFGIQTLEAMACGVPILGFDWAGTRDLVEHGVEGYLAKPGDYQDLLEGLRYCLENGKTLGANGTKKSRRFTWARTAEMVAEVYRLASEEHDGPEVSIIIPCYNYQEYVRDAINSALAQNLPCEFEVIVVDDGSTDNSPAIIDEYDDRVTVIHKENGGVSSARMAGFRVSRGRFICFLDADDIMEQRWLDVNYDKMVKDDRLGISYTALRLKLKDGYREANWPPEVVDYAQLVRCHNQVPTCCMIRREAFVRAGGYRSRFEPTEDGELWVKIAECGYRIECATKTPLFTYRLGHSSLSRGKKLPDYAAWHLPSKIGTPPCALPKKPGNYPVRDYDQPVFQVIIGYTGDKSKLIDTLDGILAQSYMFWECHVVVSGDEYPDMPEYPFVRWWTAGKSTPQAGLYGLAVEQSTAPLMILIEAGVIPHNRFLEASLRDWEQGDVRKHIMPRLWYNELTRKDQKRWLAGVDAGEVLQNQSQSN